MPKPIATASCVMKLVERGAVIEHIGNFTGTRVELRGMRIDPLALRVTMQDFTVHGREPEGTPPLFHADALVVDTFLLSCRVLGRGVEHRVLARLGSARRCRAQRCFVGA